MAWQLVLPDVYLWPDSCNVYAIVGREGSLIVNAGTGQWLAHVAELPSLGTPMLQDCAGALAQLEDSLKALCAGRPWERDQIAAADTMALKQVTEHVWMSPYTSSLNWFLISESGKALAIDYGYTEKCGIVNANYSKPYRRRAMLHSLEELKTRFGIDRIDVALPPRTVATMPETVCSRARMG